MAHEARTDWAMLLGCLFLLIVGGGSASLDARFFGSRSTKLLNEVLTVLDLGRCCLSDRAHVIIYSKPGCHLCEEAKEAIRAADCESKYTLEEINIENNPELLERYRNEIPVIAIDGVKAFKYRLTAEDFRRRLGLLNSSYSSLLLR